MSEVCVNALKKILYSIPDIMQAHEITRKIKALVTRFLENAPLWTPCRANPNLPGRRRCEIGITGTERGGSVPPQEGRTPYYRVRGTYLKTYLNRSTEARDRKIAQKILNR
jgi:hypothetical protein